MAIEDSYLRQAFQCSRRSQQCSRGHRFVSHHQHYAELGPLLTFKKVTLPKLNSRLKIAMRPNLENDTTNYNMYMVIVESGQTLW